jgi:hypothetical protein
MRRSVASLLPSYTNSIFLTRFHFHIRSPNGLRVRAMANTTPGPYLPLQNKDEPGVTETPEDDQTRKFVGMVYEHIQSIQAYI